MDDMIRKLEMESTTMLKRQLAEARIDIRDHESNVSNLEEYNQKMKRVITDQERTVSKLQTHNRKLELELAQVKETTRENVKMYHRCIDGMQKTIDGHVARIKLMRAQIPKHAFREPFFA